VASRLPEDNIPSGQRLWRRLSAPVTRLALAPLQLHLLQLLALFGGQIAVILEIAGQSLIRLATQSLHSLLIGGLTETQASCRII